MRLLFLAPPAEIGARLGVTLLTRLSDISLIGDNT
jgi:hypothetical protein